MQLQTPPRSASASCRATASVAGDHRRDARRAARRGGEVADRIRVRSGRGRAEAAQRARARRFPEASFAAAQAADGVILGPVSHNDYPPADKGGINPSGALRKRLDLFANIRPARTRADFPPRCGKPVDLVIVRENTEGFYADRNMFLGSGEFMPTPDLALSMRKITRARLDAHRRGSVPPRDAPAQACHRRAQGERAARLRRAVPRMRARGRGALSAGALRGEDHRRDGGAAGARRQRRST